MKWSTWTRLSHLTLVPFFRRNTNLTFTSKPLLQMTRRTLLQVCLSNVVVSILCDWLSQVHSDICSVLSSHSLCVSCYLVSTPEMITFQLVLKVSTNSSYYYRVSLNYQTSIFLCNWWNLAWKLRVLITYILCLIQNSRTKQEKNCIKQRGGFWKYPLVFCCSH